MATDHSPRSPAAAAVNGGVDSPQAGRRSLPSAWASVVRGDSEQILSPTAAAAAPGVSSVSPELAAASDNHVIDSSGFEALPESSDVNGDGNAGRQRRSAWNRPVNGVVEAGPVMGGDVSWPALSESTRSVPRSSSDSTRPASDGSASSSQAPIISQPPRRQANSSVHSNSAAKNTVPSTSRPRSRNHGSGGGVNSLGTGPSQNNFNRSSPPAPPPFTVYEMPFPVLSPVFDATVRGTRPVGGVGGSQLQSGNDHSSPSNTSRRGNYGPRSRGDGPYQSSNRGRRDQDRRDIHLSPQYRPPPIGYIPSHLPPGAPPFMGPPPVRMFTGQMGFDMVSPFIYVPTIHPENFRAMPMVSPSPPPMPMNPLSSPIVSQIDYYFSDANLVRDNFLRSNMDDHGWVPITLIANFPRVQQLTQDVQLILESLRYSTIVEVQADKVRKRHEWNKWLNSTTRLNSDSSLSTPDAASESALTVSFQMVSLNEASTSANGNIDIREGHTEMATGRFLSEELIARSSMSNGDDSVEEMQSISV